MSHYISLVAGLIFGFGLALSGMTHAEIVLGFLDVSGAWNPSLLFVLGGAVGVTMVSFRFILKRESPVFAHAFNISTRRQLDAPLLIGSALFGIGWGIGGYCPGPVIALFAAPNWELAVILPGVLLGHLLQRYVAKKRGVADEDDASACG